MRYGDSAHIPAGIPEYFMRTSTSPLRHEDDEKPGKGRGDEREDEPREEHPLEMEPLLVVGGVHVLRALEAEAGHVGEEHPVEEERVVQPNPNHEAEGETEPLPEGLRPSKATACEEHRTKKTMPRPLVATTFFDWYDTSTRSCVLKYSSWMSDG